MIIFLQSTRRWPAAYGFNARLYGPGRSR